MLEVVTPEDGSSEPDLLTEIRSFVRDLCWALDRGTPHHIAAEDLRQRVMAALDMPWVQGATLEEKP